MTIAACYLSAEGVVLGADSTATFAGPHFYNFTQKVFEIGEGSTLGVLTWGLASINPVSYRTLIATLDDELRKPPAASFAEVVQKWIDLFWAAYQTSAPFTRLNDLHKKPPFGTTVTQMPVAPSGKLSGAISAAILPTGGQTPRTKAEEEEYGFLKENAGVGFCLGGYLPPDRTPAASSVFFYPLSAKPTADPLPPLSFRFFGVPNMIQRLVFGADDNLKKAILASGKWSGTEADLKKVIDGQQLVQHPLPIRDAIDFVHTCIYSTIKAMKFSAFQQVCGGPAEIAVITTDRKFRWVKHKRWDAAILDGDTA